MILDSSESEIVILTSPTFPMCFPASQARWLLSSVSSTNSIQRRERRECRARQWNHCRIPCPTCILLLGRRRERRDRVLSSSLGVRPASGRNCPDLGETRLWRRLRQRGGHLQEDLVLVRVRSEIRRRKFFGVLVLDQHTHVLDRLLELVRAGARTV